MEDSALIEAFDDIESGDPEYQLLTATFLNLIHQPVTPLPGSIVVLDPYEVYLKPLLQGTEPNRLVMAKEPSALW